MFGTNIGATILLSRVLQQWQSTAAPVSDRELYGAVFALAVGSNFGAYSFVCVFSVFDIGHYGLPAEEIQVSSIACRVTVAKYTGAKRIGGQ